MRQLILLLISFFANIAVQAQQKTNIDTVVIRVDSTFESLIHRKLYNYRNHVKYHIEERGRIRELIVYLASVEDLVTGHKLYGIRIDQRGSRNIFTDAPMTNAEYIDEDEIDSVITHLKYVKDEIKKRDPDQERYTEYRFFTRSGFMIECYTGSNRWRCLIHYEVGKTVNDVYLNNNNRLEEFIETLEEISKEIKELRNKNK
jgi:hypothetical protein